MNFHQMRYLCEVARRNYNLSEVARVLHTSQPGISRQIQMLEEELGFPVLTRQGKRITGFTRQGAMVLATAKRLMGDFNGLRQLSEDHRRKSGGKLIVATTHFHARYTLLGAVLKFRRTHPKVSLILHQSDPLDIARRVTSEEADIGISVVPPDAYTDLVALPCLSVKRVLITPREHPLLAVSQATLQKIAMYPLIAYDRKLGGGWRVMRAFEDQGLAPNIVLTATDADVIKAYVAAGLGVAVVQASVYDRKKDRELRAVDVSHLFQPGPSVLMMRRQVYVSEVVRDFVGAVTPEIDLDSAVLTAHAETKSS